MFLRDIFLGATFGVVGIVSVVAAQPVNEQLRQMREDLDATVKANEASKRQRDEALKKEIADRKARIKALQDRMNDHPPSVTGVAKADPAETACKLAYHQAALDQCKKKGPV